MDWMYKEDFLAHYGVKGMKWHNRKKKSITFDNSSNAYRYDTNNSWFKSVTAKTKIPGRSQTNIDNIGHPRGLYLDKSGNKVKPKDTTIVKKSSTSIDELIYKGKEIVDDALKSIGSLFSNIFKKK